MKQLQPVQTKCIRDTFSKNYIIPEFQRPYSWDKEECIKLFDDIKDFFDANKSNDEQYYLGNLILYPQNKNHNEYCVIDGQQRLTTLMLLLAALYSISQENMALKNCLLIKDGLTDEYTNNLKIKSMVVEDDKKELEDVILNKNTTGKTKIKKNYNSLLDSIGELDSNDIGSFILTVLDRVVLLPIECDSLEDAMILFNTVNNRGLPLNDADIFKSHLFKNAKTDNDKKVLIKRWNELNEDDNIESLFRKLMHIKRSERQETGKEIALRKYFEENNNKLLEDWNGVLNDLEKIDAIDTDLPTSKLKNLWEILHCVPNEYSLYPIIVFWYKNAIIDEKENTFILSNEHQTSLEKLMLDTVKYSFASAIVYNSVNVVKDPIHKVCVEIYHDRDYLKIYKENYMEKTFPVFKDRINNFEYKRCRFGLIYILAFINKEQNQDNLNLAEKTKLEIEHILPRNGYNNYDGWTEEEYNDKLDTLGNLVLFEKKLNIKASNEFFNKKKKEYEKSNIQEAKDLCSFSDWTYDTWKKRNDEKEQEIISFFETFDIADLDNIKKVNND